MKKSAPKKKFHTNSQLKAKPINDIVKPEVPSVSSLVDKKEESLLDKHNKKLFIFGLFSAVLIIFLNFLVMLFIFNQNKNENTANKNFSEQMDSKPSIVPSITPEKETIDRSKWSLEILNGTLKPGLARDVADRLEKKGYKVSKTGNADSNSYSETQIFISNEKEDLEIQLFMEDVGVEFDVSEPSGEIDGLSNSARIIIGANYN